MAGHRSLSKSPGPFLASELLLLRVRNVSFDCSELGQGHASQVTQTTWILRFEALVSACPGAPSWAARVKVHFTCVGLPKLHRFSGMGSLP